MTKIDTKATEAYFENLRPDVERLIRKVDENPQACIMAAIFSQNPPCLAYVTNLANEGADILRLSMVLFSLVVDSKENIHGRVPFMEFSTGSMPAGRAPEELADALADMVLITGMDESYMEKVLQLAQQYKMARRPNGSD